MKAYERLIRYTAYPTASCEASESAPSSPAQMVFARALAEEMLKMGIKDASVDEFGCCFGTVPASEGCENGPVLGLIAHMDVVEVVPYENIRTSLIKNYDGGIVTLANGTQIDPAQFPFLANYRGETLLVTDGNTLLGADDKAGVAIILTFAEYCLQHPEYKHGKIRIGFTPDEEIGRGTDHFDVAKFGADYAYTLDGGAFGEIEYETFNAASARVTVHGKSIHPGGAKNRMVNAIRVAAFFDTLLPEAERPEHTEGREGFYHLEHAEGSVETTVYDYILRDHDLAKLQTRKARMLEAAAACNSLYGEGTVEVELKDAYLNMYEILKDHMELIENARTAICLAGGEPVSHPVRGGTDGCRLSYMGLPCPNLGTGSHNHHGRTEFAVTEEMDKCVDMLVYLAKR